MCDHSSAHQVSLYFGNNHYEIEIDSLNHFNDFDLKSGEALDMFKSFIGTEKTIKMNDTQFQQFRKLFDALSEQLKEISDHSDYNSDDYIPFTSEIKESLNEKYIQLFRFIKEQVL